jgi:hypothetical protein
MQKSLHNHREQSCNGISHKPSCSNKSQRFASTPTREGWRFWYGARLESQVWLIRVESRLREATVGGEPLSTVKYYLKRPLLVGALDPHCFCVHRVILQVAEGSGTCHRGARAKEQGRETYGSWSQRLQAASVAAIKDWRSPRRHRHVSAFHLIDYVMIT